MFAVRPGGVRGEIGTYRSDPDTARTSVRGAADRPEIDDRPNPAGFGLSAVSRETSMAEAEGFEPSMGL